jgi:hypothetical protein
MSRESTLFISFGKNRIRMPRPHHYSPAIDRFLVSVLYHEAKRQRKPMTQLTNNLLETALRGTNSWRKAENAIAQKENPPENTHQFERQSPAQCAGLSAFKQKGSYC